MAGTATARLCNASIARSSAVPAHQPRLPPQRACGGSSCGEPARRRHRLVRTDRQPRRGRGAPGATAPCRWPWRQRRACCSMHLKTRLVRERRFSYAAIRLGTAPLDRYSFPSGHTCTRVFHDARAAHFALAVLLVPFAVAVLASRVVARPALSDRRGPPAPALARPWPTSRCASGRAEVARLPSPHCPPGWHAIPGDPMTRTLTSDPRRDGYRMPASSSRTRAG